MDLANIVTDKKKRESLNRNQKYRYYKNYFTPEEKDELYQKNIKKKGQALILVLNKTHGMSTVRS